MERLPDCGNELVLRSCTAGRSCKTGAMPLRRRVWEIVEFAREGDRVSRVFDVVIIALIIVNVLATILETVEPLGTRYGAAFFWFEWVSVAIFSVELALRFWSSAECAESGGWAGRWRWLRSPGAIIDIVAVAPAWLALLGGPALDGRTLRALRLMRLFRLFKLMRYHRTLRLMSEAVKERREELVLSLVLTMLLLLVASSLMYQVEHDAQPELFSSIPATMWWGIATLTTVGYGDLAPVTALGRLLGGIVAILGIGLFALPAGILSSAFSDVLQRRRMERQAEADAASNAAAGLEPS